MTGQGGQFLYKENAFLVMEMLTAHSPGRKCRPVDGGGGGGGSVAGTGFLNPKQKKKTRKVKKRARGNWED